VWRRVRAANARVQYTASVWVSLGVMGER
jgi:hypothetical protein